MILCRVTFPLPINIGIDNHYFTVRDPELVGIEIHMRKGSDAFCYQSGEYAWLGRTNPGGTYRGPNGDQEQLFQFASGHTPESFEGGVRNHIYYSSVNVLFERPESHAPEDDQASIDIGPDVSFAKSHVLRFLSHFRLVKHKPYLATHGDIMPPIVFYTTARLYEFREGHYRGEFVQPPQSFGTIRHPRLTGWDFSELSNAELSELTTRLNGRQEPELHEILTADAEMQSVRYQAHDLAIVHLETAFEVYVQRMLLVHCQKYGVARLPDRKGRPISAADAVTKGHIMQNLLGYIRLVRGQNALSTQECRNWKRDLYDKRNAIAHRGISGASETDFGQALTSARCFMTWIGAALQ
jgi:hypothetical protein